MPEGKNNNEKIPKLSRLNLSAKAVKEMSSWPKPLIDDYLKLAEFCTEVSFYLNSPAKKYYQTTSG